jgi:hypothetical protein
VKSCDRSNVPLLAQFNTKPYNAFGSGSVWSHSRIGWLTPAARAAQFGPQWTGPLRIESSATRPIAPIMQMEKINRQIQLVTG